MVSRTIENDRDRRMTIMITTFDPCGAKLPVIALIAGSFFYNGGRAVWSAYNDNLFEYYFKKLQMFVGAPAPPVME